MPQCLVVDATPVVESTSQPPKIIAFSSKEQIAVANVCTRGRARCCTDDMPATGWSGWSDVDNNKDDDVPIEISCKSVKKKHKCAHTHTHTHNV